MRIHEPYHICYCNVVCKVKLETVMNSYVFDKSVNAGNDLGIKKQCVEFARRWLYENKGMIYQDVVIAADIWDKVNCYTRLLDARKIPVENVINGAFQLPKPGDLIIYSEKYMNTGHVSVVVNVSELNGLIDLLEQNFDNHQQLPNQQRSISFTFHKQRYWLLDSYLLGWKSIEE